MSQPPVLRASRRGGRCVGTCPPRSRSHIRYSPSQSTKRNRSVITSVANSELLTELQRTPFPLASPPENGGGERDRTDDLLLAKQALSQLSYTPGSGRHFCHLMVGQGGFEPP